MGPRTHLVNNKQTLQESPASASLRCFKRGHPSGSAEGSRGERCRGRATQESARSATKRLSS
eukprot:5178876-Prymnesium_polylepis.1